MAAGGWGGPPAHAGPVHSPPRGPEAQEARSQLPGRPGSVEGGSGRPGPATASPGCLASQSCFLLSGHPTVRITGQPGNPPAPCMSCGFTLLPEGLSMEKGDATPRKALLRESRAG